MFDKTDSECGAGKRISVLCDKKKLLELLAELEHDRWARWQKHVHAVCEHRPDGSLLIPSDRVKGWERQINTTYFDLSEKEQISDQEEAYRTIHLLESLGMEF